MRSLGISVLSLTLTTIVIANAYYQKKQFYPSVVYITKSNPSMAVIYIQAFICVLIVGKIMRKIFFGQLRSAEFEHLMERSWYAITETCLAFTVFRDDFNPKFVALFTLLLFLKSFHWLAEDRVDYMERSPVISLLFHIRVLSLLLLLGSLDLHFIQHAYQSTVSKGASVQLVFGFEYAILLTVVINIAIKYALHSVDLNSETPWDNKAVFLLYTELIMGFIKVILYVAFVAIMVRIYTLPLFAFRPMYYTIRNFKKAFSDVILSRRAIYNMNTLYPDATPEELQAADNVCIICREEMTTASKKLPCNHIFHTSCLRSWFQRQQTCPTCRLNILRTPTSNNNEPRQDQRHRQVPLNPPNPFFNPFGGQNPFQMFGQNNQQQPQAQPATGGTATGAQNATNAPQANPNIPPFVFPPFPFMPFMAPPPMPPPNLQSLSPEELRRMEGNERQNVEARIQCLRNIQVMLDAAVVMMQQYSAAAALSSQTPSGEPQPGPSTSGTSPTCNGTTPKSPINLPTSSVINNNVESDSVASTSTSNETPSETTTESVALTPEEEVRRRRLQKFQQAAEQ
ncbi:E3 ubiquitin-protein ligase synoviolin A [Tribolium madens]|uniref:E3 ubiquitin-protein ligase synoviolin A n=1 Tax=Tribolium madens TaxID=41895 RepID=UPI001CF750FE|nr:E3 ubiquitin-protein ligase synoviolin A [Tribolium madens]XP_044264834.1 E3 ubiquitin-protein ligase synoviolin A [Tribolium madens]